MKRLRKRVRYHLYIDPHNHTKEQIKALAAIPRLNRYFHNHYITKDWRVAESVVMLMRLKWQVSVEVVEKRYTKRKTLKKTHYDETSSRRVDTSEVK